MLDVHSFFIPDIEHVEDIEALLTYIHRKVKVEFKCLHCDHEGAHLFKSAQAVQQHMLSKQHCFLNSEDNPEEYALFYEQSDPNLSSLVARDEALPFEVMESGELRLKSGVVLGHKKYARYYKQRLIDRPDNEAELRAIKDQESEDTELEVPWKGLEAIQRKEDQNYHREIMRQAEQSNKLMAFHRCQNPK